MRWLELCRRGFATSTRSISMAKSKYEYVKKFEREEMCLPETWMVLRLDGRCFHKCVFYSQYNVILTVNTITTSSNIALICGACLG